MKNRTFNAYLINIVILALLYAALLTQSNGLINIALTSQWVLGLVTLMFFNKEVCLKSVIEFYEKNPDGTYFAFSGKVSGIFFIATVLPMIYFGWWFTAILVTLRGAAFVLLHATDDEECAARAKAAAKEVANE